MSKTPRAWFRMEASTADSSVVDIHIIDIIGDWTDELINEYWGMKATVTAKAFIKQLAELPDSVKSIRVHINSPGGDVFAATNIANALRDQQLTKGRTVDTIVDGLAASAASIIMMAGKAITVADNALVMIHNPWTIAIGDAAEMRKVAAMCDTVRASIIAAYQWHSKLETDAIAALMDAETWMDADTAITNGFATQKTKGLDIAAFVDARVMDALKVPDAFKARVQAFVKKDPPPPQAADPAVVLAAVETAGLSVAFARQLIAGKLPLDQVNAKIEIAKTEQATKAQRAQDITALCKTAKVPELAATLIASAMPLTEVRAHLTIVAAKIDAGEVDNKLPPGGGGARASQSDLTDAYSKLNQKESR